MAEQKMIAYGAKCSWWDDKEKVGTLPMKDGSRLPCCPHCRSVLFEMPEEQWNDGADKYEADNPGYKKLLNWSRGKCFPSWKHAKATYEAIEQMRG